MLPQTIAAMLAQAAASAPTMRELARTSPTEYSSGKVAEALGTATHERIAEVGETSDMSKSLSLKQRVPSDTKEAITKSIDYASYSPRLDRDTLEQRGGRVNINPNASREILAHELGHHVTANTKMGRLVHNLRMNPKLAIALGAGVLGIPAVQSSLQAGDDDAAAGVAIASLLSSPTLINEALATKNGLAILEKAGMRADMGQRARLAGAYLSYAAAPVIAGLAGNSIGNVLDNHTAVYDL